MTSVVVDTVPPPAHFEKRATKRSGIVWREKHFGYTEYHENGRTAILIRIVTMLIQNIRLGGSLLTRSAEREFALKRIVNFSCITWTLGLIALICGHAMAQISKVQQVLAYDGQAGDQLGASVAMSGNILVVGANQRNNGTGAAYIYTLANGAWEQTNIISASDGRAGDAFGFAVAVNAATNTIVVTAPNRRSGAAAAYVFGLSGTNWNQKAKLTAIGGLQGDCFGCGLGFNGLTVVIGAPFANAGKGAAYVFSGSGSVWTQKARLTANDARPYSWLGFSAGINGNTIVLGAPEYHIGAGAAYVFTASGSVWG